MYIKNGYRGQGIGNALLNAVITHAKNRVIQLHLTVVTTNQTALKLYQKNGFRVYGTEPRALKIGDQFYDEHMMVLELSNG
jgi:ribosomal protein S18 acetylase RimI-like enzyme